MIKQNSGSSDSLSIGRLLCILGIVIAVFSLAMGALILFAIPSGCTFVGGLELVLLGGFFLVGLLALLIGKVLLYKKGKA